MQISADRRPQGCTPARPCGSNGRISFIDVEDKPDPGASVIPVEDDESVVVGGFASHSKRCVRDKNSEGGGEHASRLVLDSCQFIQRDFSIVKIKIVGKYKVNFEHKLQHMPEISGLAGMHFLGPMVVVKSEEGLDSGFITAMGRT